MTCFQFDCFEYIVIINKQISVIMIVKLKNWLFISMAKNTIPYNKLMQ